MASEIRYSVVVPVYGNAETIPALLERLDQLAAQLDGPMEGVFVVDGSPDGSLLLLRRLLQERSFASQLIAHSRNFGSFAAIRTGFAAARGDFVAAMAADLQEPAELVQTFFGYLASGEYDVAVGTPHRARRSAHDDAALARLLVACTGAGCTARSRPAASTSSAARARSRASSSSSTSRARASSGCSTGSASAASRCRTRARRARSGRSGWSLRRKLAYFLDSVFSFTDVPVTLLVLVGAIGGVVTIITSIVVLVARLTGAINQTGYTPLMLVVLLSTFALLFGLGIVGSYVWRTYENSKGRPGAVAMTHESFEREARR